MRDGEPAGRCPIYFGLEVTRRCNLACPHCLTGSGGDQHPGPEREALRRVFSQLVELGVDRVALSGGEPLVRSDLEDLMADGLEAGLLRYGLVTNGLLVDRDRARRLKGAGLAVAQVSLDGVDARDHGAIRDCPPRAWVRAVDAIRLLREEGVAVDVATILAGANPGRGPEMLRLCEDLGVRKLRYCSFVPAGRGARASVRRSHQPPPERLDEFLEFFRACRARERPVVDVVIDHGIGPWTEDGSFRCVAGRGVAYVTGEGDLYPCPTLMFEPFKVGNVREAPLRELLRSPRMLDPRRTRQREVAEPCASCAAPHCRGGCPGAAFAASGDLVAAPAYCSFQRRMTATI